MGLTVRTAHRVERITRDSGELVLRGEVGEPGSTLGAAIPGALGREELGGLDLFRRYLLRMKMIEPSNSPEKVKDNTPQPNACVTWPSGPCGPIATSR